MAAATAAPILATKLFAPARRSRLVARPAIAERLDGALETGCRLSLVSGPAGFGKSTALTAWLADLEQRPGHPGVGWLSLDDGDNDPFRFLAHLAAALQNAGLEVGAALDSPPATPFSGVLTVLVNEVARAQQSAPEAQWLLVLDDYHVIEAPEVHQAVTFLLDHLPDHLHLIIATRSDPPLPLARLRSRGQLNEVRAADLRFTPAEAQEFLTEVMGLSVTAADAGTLQDRTEGWVAGLQLAALALRGIEDRGQLTGFVEAFAGSHRFVLDYLTDEVLARQPAQLRRFLLSTAILSRLHGPLCDAVTQSTGGQQVLEELERDNLFVVALDPERSWFRYHHLFADALHVRLLAEHPEQVAELHARASAWYAARDDAAEAVRHALAARDFARAAYLMEEALPKLRRDRQDQLLMTWMRSLPDAVVRGSPVLSTTSSWSLLMSGDLDGAERRLDDAESALAAGAQDRELAATWAPTEDLRMAPATVSMYRAALAQARGDVAGTVLHARRVLDLAGPEDHFLRGAGGGYLGLAAWAAGDVAAALATFADAVRSLQAAGNLVDALDSTIVLADMWVASGQPGRARRLHEQALQTASSGGAPYPRATADLHVGLADLDRELNHLAEAEEHLESARVLGEQGSITENQHRRHVVQAQVWAARADYGGALHRLDQAERLFRRGFYPEVRPIAALRARIQIVSGDLTSAAAWAEDRAIGLDDQPDYLREYEHLTLVRLRLAESRSADDAVLGLLSRLHAAAAQAGRAGSLREIELLVALAQHARGDRVQAMAALRRSLVEPGAREYVRLFLDEGAAMLDLLREAAASSDPDLRAQARRLLEQATPDPKPAPPSAGGPLSDRELQVLRLLDSELSGPEIARELYVTVNTLRTHTKRIFTKLDVTSRAAAIRRAREQGLL